MPETEATPILENGFSEALANSLPGIVYLFDSPGRLLWWNRRLEQVTGYTAAELTGLELARLVPARDLERVNVRFRAALASGLASGHAWVETELVLKDGSQVPYHFTGQRIDFGGVPCLIGMGSITENGYAQSRNYGKARREKQVCSKPRSTASSSSITRKWSTNSIRPPNAFSAIRVLRPSAGNSAS